MKRLIPSIPVLLTAAIALSGAGLEPAARKSLLDHLNQSQSQLMSSVKGLTAEQWNFKPNAQSWSIAECVEHIALTEGFLGDMVEGKILAAPAKPAAEKVTDDQVLKMITDRSFKAKAPEPLVPTKRFESPKAAVDAFKKNREKIVALAKKRDDLRDHSAPHPALKDLDAYQWLLYTSGHTMRHTAQIQEVKSNPGYPKGK